MGPKPAGKYLNLICPGRWRFQNEDNQMKKIITLVFLLIAVRLSATSVRLSYNGNPSLAGAVTCSLNDSLRQVTIAPHANLGVASIVLKRQATTPEVSTSINLVNNDLQTLTISTTQPNRYVITITLSDGTCYSGVFSIGMSSNNSATYTYDNAGNRNQRTIQ